MGQGEEPGERRGAPGVRGDVALAQPGLHGSAQMENATKAIIAALITMVATAATSILERRLTMRQSLAAVERQH